MLKKRGVLVPGNTMSEAGKLMAVIQNTIENGTKSKSGKK